MFIIHDNHNIIIYMHITIKGLNATIEKMQMLMT